jgi:glucan phosphoethanolaminetransferase (alkaline phosphatase superfamily)
MSPFPKPRGFWDYGLFALAMTGGLLLLFWVDATDRLRWTDVLLAAAGAVLLVLLIIIMRRREKARWIAHPTWRMQLLVTLGVLFLLFGIVYADAYLLHRREIASDRLQHAVIPMVALATTLWASRRRPHSQSQVS